MSVFSLLSDLLETGTFGIGTMTDAEHHILPTATASGCGPIPPGLEIPDEWGYTSQDPGPNCWKTRPWEPKFFDDPDIETRKCKDIEDFTAEEMQTRDRPKPKGLGFYKDVVEAFVDFRSG